MKKSIKLQRVALLDKLLFIRDKVCEYDRQKVESAVIGMNEREIDNMILSFDLLNSYFFLESDNLQKYAETYNKKYATEHNGVFSVGLDALEQIKHQVFFLYRLLNTTGIKPTLKKLKRMNDTIDVKSIEFISDHSILGTMPFTREIPGLVKKTPKQKKLIADIIDFLTHLRRNIDLCQKMITEEKQIGEDTDACTFLFEMQLDEICDCIQGNYRIPKKHQESEWLREITHAYEQPKYFKKYFHKLNTSQMTSVSYAIRNTSLDKYTILEKKVYQSDIKALINFRNEVKRLVDSGKKVTGEDLVEVYNSTRCVASQSSFHRCFIDTYNSLGGNQKIVSNQQFNSSFTKIHLNKDWNHSIIPPKFSYLM